MKTIVRFAFALTLGISAAAALITPSAPAHACGGYGDVTPEVEVHRASERFLRSERPDVRDPRIEKLEIEGKNARVQVRFRTSKGAGELAQFLFLSQDDDARWNVTGQSYPFST
jgi:hypothetical protein